MKQITAYATATFIVPHEAEAIPAAGGALAGFRLNGKEYRPVIGFDTGEIGDSVLVTDTLLQKAGIECIEYIDAGIEEEDPDEQINSELLDKESYKD